MTVEKYYTHLMRESLRKAEADLARTQEYYQNAVIDGEKFDAAGSMIERRMRDILKEIRDLHDIL